jgi:hypothetical protein
MANLPKKNINPFLFFLLKRMLDYEFVKMGPEPNVSQLAELIYNKHKSEKYSKSYFTSPVVKRDSFAYQKAERLRKYVLSSKKLELSKQMLDHLAAEVSVIDQFMSWDHFVSKYGEHRCAITSEIAYKNELFHELPPDVKQKIVSQANLLMYSLHKENLRKGNGLSQHTIYSNSEYSVRTAIVSEIKEIEILANRIYPCPVNGFEIKKPWHDKNPNIFFIYRDEFDVWGNINLLPLSDRTYQLLKSGNLYESEITKEDIFLEEHKDKVNYVYIEGLACTLKEVLIMFVKSFDQMIDKVANIKNPDLLICAIGGSDEGDRLMRNSGFQRTGWATDPKTKKVYPFLEIKWQALKLYLEKKKIFPPDIVSQNKLTPYGQK